jgi:hypothetical protein
MPRRLPASLVAVGSAAIALFWLVGYTITQPAQLPAAQALPAATSPARDPDQAWFGAAAALAAFVVFRTWPSPGYLLAGLLVANPAVAVRAALRSRGPQPTSMEA